MNRLEAKCLIASAGLHTLLVVILVFGAAFFKDKDADAPKTVFTMFSSQKIAELASGGNPQGGAIEHPPETPAQPAPPAPVAPPPPPPLPAPVSVPEPAPEPAPAPVVRVTVPDPRPTPTRPPKSAPKTDIPRIEEVKGKATAKKAAPTKSAQKETAKKADTSKKTEVVVNLDTKTISRKTDPKSKPRQESDQEAEDRAMAAAQERANRVAALQRQTAISSSLHNLQKGLSSSGGLSLEPLGPGGGSSGEAFIDYNSVVLTAYDQAWIVGNEVTDELSSVKVRVTIARDGKVLSARIIRRSGNGLLDRSVQSALESVRSIAPFPDTTREAEKTFTFNFNLKAKRQSG